MRWHGEVEEWWETSKVVPIVTMIIKVKFSFLQVNE